MDLIRVRHSEPGLRKRSGFYDCSVAMQQRSRRDGEEVFSKGSRPSCSHLGQLPVVISNSALDTPILHNTQVGAATLHNSAPPPPNRKQCMAVHSAERSVLLLLLRQLLQPGADVRDGLHLRPPRLPSETPQTSAPTHRALRGILRLRVHAPMDTLPTVRGIRALRLQWHCRHVLPGIYLGNFPEISQKEL